MRACWLSILQRESEQDVAKAKPTKKKTGKTSKTSKGKGKGKGKGAEGAYGLPSDEELEKEAQAIDAILTQPANDVLYHM